MGLTVNNKPNTQTIKVANKVNQAVFTINNKQNQAIQPPIYNPQPAVYTPAPPPVVSATGFRAPPTPRIQGTGSSNYSSTSSQDLIAAAARQADQMRIAAELQRRQLADAKNIAISKSKAGFLSKLSDKVTFGQDRRGRSARENAVKFANQNQNNWFPYIEARKREYERQLAEKHDYLIQHQNDPNFEKELNDAIAWAQKQETEINSEADNYNKNQKGLYSYSATPLNTKAADLLHTVGSSLSSTGHTIFKTATSIASTPERVINTAKNFINPNVQRTYYGGGEAKGNLPQNIKAAWNAALNERLFGNSKAEEKSRTSNKTFTVKDQHGNPLVVHQRPDGFQKFLAKYGDDIGNFLADPTVYLSGGAKGAFKIAGDSRLVAKGFAAAGKSDKLTKALLGFTAATSMVKDTKIGKLAGFLNKPVISKQEKFLQDNKDLITRRQALGGELSEVVDNWRKAKTAATQPFVNAVKALTPEEATMLQKFITHTLPADSEFGSYTRKTPHSWENVVQPRGFGKQSRQKVEDLSRQWKTIGDQLHAQEREHVNKLYNGNVPRNSRVFYNKGYVPRAIAPKAGSRFPNVKGGFAAPFYSKRKIDYSLQSKDELTHSFEKRITSQLWRHQPEAAFLNKHAGKYLDELDNLHRELAARRFRDFELNKSGRVSKVVKAPMKLWKKSVLQYRPAWYVNNVAWNIPASLSAGGSGTTKQYAKLIKAAFKERTMSPSLIRELPDDVASQVGQLFGFDRKAGGKLPLATKLENFSRAAAYRNLTEKGYSKDRALKRTNDWLFNYQTKNWERPLKTIMPFWAWQKGLSKLALKMPFKYPRQSKEFFGAYKQFYQRPQDSVPNQNVDYTDEATGQHIKFNKKDKYKGRLKIGNSWYNTPFNAMTDQQLSAIGLNPFIQALSDYASSADKFGNKNTDRAAWKILAEKFPQFQLAENFKSRNEVSKLDWFSKSGYGKEASGADPNAANYRGNLDNKSKFTKSLLSFLGKPSSITDNPVADAKAARYTKFNKDYFNIDWNKRLDNYKTVDPGTAYAKLAADKQALAKKHGFDFTKDIQSGAWTKYDTSTTTHTKLLKNQAAAFDNQYWQDYAKVPNSTFVKTAKGGYWTASKKNDFWLSKFSEWKDKHSFADNAYKQLPHFNKPFTQFSPTDINPTDKVGDKYYLDPYKLSQKVAASKAKAAAGSAKYALWQQYFKLGNYSDKAAFLRAHPELLVGKAKRQTFQFQGKFFKSQATMDKYIAGFNKHNGTNFKTSTAYTPSASSVFWKKYYSIGDKKARLALARANPQFSKFGTNNLQAALAYSATKKQKEKANVETNVAGFSQHEQELLAVATTKAARYFNRPRRVKKVVFKVK